MEYLTLSEIAEFSARGLGVESKQVSEVFCEAAPPFHPGRNSDIKKQGERARASCLRLNPKSSAIDLRNRDERLRSWTKFKSSAVSGSQIC